MEETIYPKIRRILAPNPSPMTYTGTNTYLIGDKEIAVIDPGPKNAFHLNAILKAIKPGSKITKIFLIIGIVFFGLPLCWLILARGMWGKSSLINSPMLNFETSMSGFGMYVKYLMAAFLIIFALSMIFQFTAYLLNSIADIEEKITDDASDEEVNAEWN